MINMVIIGPPGSGKDTQIDIMRKLFDFKTVSTGDIARRLTDHNDKYRQIVESGGLLDDKALTNELDKAVSQIASDMGVVFDGYPRTLHQAELLNEILLHHNRILDRVIYINLDEAAVVERLSVRRVCSLCGHNIIGVDRCPACGGEPTRRHDDEPAVIMKRVQTFLENTLPLIDYYHKRGLLIQINGDQSISDVAKEIKGKLGYAGE
jgi:adenylate kinase